MGGAAIPPSILLLMDVEVAPSFHLSGVWLPWVCVFVNLPATICNAYLGGELLGHGLTPVNFLRICQTISCRSSAIVIPTARPKCASFTAFLVNSGYFPLSVRIPAVLAGECGISPQGGCEFAFS